MLSLDAGITVEGGYQIEGECCTMVQKTADKVNIG